MTDSTQATTTTPYDGKDCTPITIGPIPDPAREPECERQCDCPPGACGGSSTCLDELIEQESKIVKDGDSAKEFVEVLKVLQGKAQAALLAYTPAKAADLGKTWEEQHKKIVEAGRQLECAVPCWACVVECHLCRRLNRIRRQRRRLYGTGKFPGAVDSLQEKLAWLERMQAASQRVLDRVKDLLVAWEDPAKTLADALDKNGKLVDEVMAKLATDPATALYAFFMTLVPRHAVIAPPGADLSALAKYLDLCAKCDPGAPEKCCGVDVGEQPVRLEILGYLPSIIDPANLTDLICCLASNRYVAAKDAVATIKGEYANTRAEIDRLAAAVDIKALRDSVAKAFKDEITAPVDCDKYKRKSGTQSNTGCSSGA